MELNFKETCAISKMTKLTINFDQNDIEQTMDNTHLYIR